MAKTKRAAARSSRAKAKAKATKGTRARSGGRGARKSGAARKQTARRTSPPPRRAAVPAAPRGPDEARPTAIAIAKAAMDKKAEDVLVLDVRGLTSYADYFVVMTADSDRQASAIADHVDETMKGKGLRKVGVEGYETGRWILVDYGDVVAHVMNRESRGFYDLEGLWADAPRFRVDE